MIAFEVFIIVYHIVVGGPHGAIYSQEGEPTAKPDWIEEMSTRAPHVAGEVGTADRIRAARGGEDPTLP